jgi:hypothetical protein
MGKRFEKLTKSDRAFIASQHLFFIASSSNGGEVNLSPKGYDTFRVIGDNEAIFMDYVGSGNRTGRDIKNGGEVTLLFTAFEGAPQILRLFCKGELIDRDDAEARSYFKGANFKGMRRFIKFRIYCVEHSCGMSVPYYEYKGERNELREWCVDGDRAGRLEAYETKHALPDDLSRFREKNL